MWEVIHSIGMRVSFSFRHLKAGVEAHLGYISAGVLTYTGPGEWPLGIWWILN